MNHKNLQTPLISDLIFVQPLRINMNNLEQIAASEMSKNPTNYFLREIWDLKVLHGSQTVAFYYT